MEDLGWETIEGFRDVLFPMGRVCQSTSDRTLCTLQHPYSYTAALAAVPDVRTLRVPAGFQTEVLTDAVPNVRQMALGAFSDGKGVLCFGSMGAGKVYAVEIQQDCAKAVHTVASGLQMPVSARCNICESDARYANIQRMKPDGSALETVAAGVRNSVGFDWSARDRSLWFAANGREMPGDDLPSDERKRACTKFVAPVAKLGTDLAALGMRFYTGEQFPVAHRNSIHIAEHGSWTRSSRVGYRVVRVMLDAQGKVLGQE